MSTEINEILKLAKKLKFIIVKTNNNHYMFCGYGKKLFFSSTPSDWRGIIRVKKNLQKIANDIHLAKY